MPYTKPQPERGNRSKFRSGTLKGVRQDVSPGDLKANEFRRAEGVFVTRRGLERVNNFETYDGSFSDTTYPLLIASSITDDLIENQGTPELIQSDGSVRVYNSTTDRGWSLRIGITITISSSGTIGTLPSSVSVGGVSYTYGAYNTFNLKPGDRIRDCTKRLVGSGLTITGSGIPSLAALSSTRVAFFDDAIEELRAYDFNGSTWSLVGSGLSISGTTNSVIAALSSTRVAFFDLVLASLRAYDFDGSTWSLVGSGLTISSAGAPAICALSSTRVAFFSDTIEELRAYDFNGSTWSLVGSGLSIPATGTVALAALTSSRVVLFEPNTEELQTYDFNGSIWSIKGSPFRIASSGVPALAALSASRIVFIDSVLDELRTYDFDGSVFSLSGTSLAISTVGSPAVAAMTSSRVAFIDSGNDSLRAYDVAGSSVRSGTVKQTDRNIINFDSGTTLVDGSVTDWEVIYEGEPVAVGDETALFDQTIFNGRTLITSLDRPFGPINYGISVSNKQRGTSFAWPVSSVASDNLFSLTARTIEVFQNFIYIGCVRDQESAIGSKIFPNRIRWSSASAPLTDWTDPLAFIDLPNSNGNIVKLFVNNQYLMVYCDTGIFYGQLTGDPTLPVNFQELMSDNTGLVGVRAICRARGLHFFVGKENIYVLSGLETQIVGDPIVIQTLRNCVNPSFIQMVFDTRKQRILVGFPTDDPDVISEIWALSLDAQSWSLAYTRDTHILAAVQAPSSDDKLQNIFVDEFDTPNYLLKVESADNVASEDATQATVLLETGDIGMENQEQIKEFYGIWIYLQENYDGYSRTASITYTVAISVDHGVTYRQVGSVRFLPNQAEAYCNFRARGNHIRIKLTSTSLVAPYGIINYVLDVKGMEAQNDVRTQGFVGV